VLGQPAHVPAVAVHDVEIDEVSRIGGQLAFVDDDAFRPVGVPIRGEDDLPSVRRPRALRVVATRAGQAPGRPLARRARRREEVVVLVVVPAVAALLAGGPRGELGLLLGAGLRVEVGGGVEDLLAARMDPAAGRLADARRDAADASAAQVHQVDLEEGVAGLALALEDEPPAILGEVAFARAAPREAQLPRLREQGRLGGRGPRGLGDLVGVVAEGKRAGRQSRERDRGGDDGGAAEPRHARIPHGSLAPLRLPVACAEP
jgi:hypothetical protein